MKSTFVSVCAVGSYNGRVFYDKEISFILGEGSEVTIGFLSSNTHSFHSLANDDSRPRISI